MQFRFRTARPAVALSLTSLAAALLSACGGAPGAPGATPLVPAASNADRVALAGEAPVPLTTLGDATPARCSAPPPDPITASVALTGAAQVVHIPCFKDFTATADVPANNAKGVVVKLAVSTDKKLGAPNAKYGTPIAYTSLDPAKTVQFSNAKAPIVTVVASPSQIAAPHTYAMQVYVPAFGLAIQTVTGIKPKAGTHEITFSIQPPGGSFPALQAIVIVYRST